MMRRYIFFLISLIIITSISITPASASYSDDFAVLDPQWHWVRNDTSSIVAGGYLYLNSTTTDLGGATQNASLLLRNNSDSDITIIANLSGNPTSNYHGGFIMAYKNDTYWVKAGYYYASGVYRGIIGNETDVATSSYTTLNIVASDPIYLKLVKAGMNYSFYLSNATQNRTAWTYVGSKILTQAITDIGLSSHGGVAGTIAFKYDYFETNTAPASVTAPQTTTGNFWVNNTWEYPANEEITHVVFKYDNGTLLQNVTDPTNFLNLTYQPHYFQSITAQTVDVFGNENSTLVNFTTSISNNPVTISGVSGTYSVTEGGTVAFDAGYSDEDTNEYVTFTTNSTPGASTFNTTSGEFSWTTTLTDAGAYPMQICADDHYGSTSCQDTLITVNDLGLTAPTLSNSTGNFYVNWTWTGVTGADAYNVTIYVN